MQEQPIAPDATSEPRSEPEPDALEGSPIADDSLEAEAAPATPEDAPAEAREPTPPSAVVPLPGMHRQEQPKTSFWKRIRLSRRGVGAATADDRMIARLDAIASRIESVDEDLAARIRHLDERFTEVWEVEEQLSRLMELREMLERQSERQRLIETRTRSIDRRLGLVVALAIVATIASLGAITAALL